jgi:hypothetical protein
MKEDDLDRSCSTQRGDDSRIEYLSGKPCKRPFGRRKHRWEDIIKNTREWGLNWIQLAQNKAECQTFVNMVMNTMAS